MPAPEEFIELLDLVASCKSTEKIINNKLRINN